MTTKEIRKEMVKEIIKMEVESCEKCKFKNECEKYELFWACGVWEDEMGDDL